VRYYAECQDDDGYIHSVDMVIVDYYLKCNYSLATDKLLEGLSQVDGFDSDKNASLGNYPNFKYMFYVDMIWFNGMVLYFGKYASYDKVNKSWTKLDMMRFKINPNKHMDSPALRIVLDFIREWCADGYLVRWDYAIDVPVAIADVMIIGSRKEKGLYKGTRYYGQRHKHGYLKVYDKQKEQGLDSVLTRLEYTFEVGLPYSWDNIVIRAPVAYSDGDSSLSGQARLYLDMLMDIKALGGEIEAYLERLNYRTYKKIEPFLFEGKQLRLNECIIDKLLSVISDIFIIADVEQKVKEEETFVEVGTDLPIPFD
jgi:hypothetical protein